LHAKYALQIREKLYEIFPELKDYKKDMEFLSKLSIFKK